MANDLSLSLAEELRRLNKRRAGRGTLRRKIKAAWLIFIRIQRDHASFCARNGIWWDL